MLGNNIKDYKKLLLNYRLTTAEITYHMPDHPLLLQTYIWQQLDLAPEFPILRKFLNFWENELDGKLHSVKVASVEIVNTNEIYTVNYNFNVH